MSVTCATTLDRAIAALCDGTVVKLVARSSDYRTPPWGVTEQPPFINCAIVAETDLLPQALLERAPIDRARSSGATARASSAGVRARSISTSSTMTGVTLDTPGLTLPHPRALERAFVLMPLAEIAPDRRIAGMRVADALAQIDRTGIEKLP